MFWLFRKGKKKEHEKLVLEVLKRLNDKNLALKVVKCELFQSEVNWLGHKLSSSSIVPKIKKTEAIVNLTPPKSPKQLRSFMGRINHLSELFPHAASLTDKLKPLLKKKMKRRN